MGTGSATGVVYLVGAGPGDPEWLTLSGADCLARADAIYFDQELPARLLDRAPRTAARFAVGSANVADLLIGAAVDGRTVVRLHAGAADPRSAAGEEMKCLRRAGVPFELIPGVGTAPPEALRCFMTRALSGVSILVTRPSSQAETLAAPLERLGAKVCRWPLIEIGPAPEPAAIEDVLRRLRDFAWLAFTSAAGVDAFMQALTDCPGADVRWLGHLRLAAIGPKTAGALKKYRLRADVVPAAFDSEHLAAALLPAVRGQSVLLARADRGRDLLRAELAQVAQVTQVAVYRQIDQPWMDEYALNELRQGRIDYVTLTSSNIARRFAEIADEGVRRWLGTSTRLVCISPVTAATAEEAGLSVAAVASTYTVEGLIQAIVEANRHPASVPLF